MEGVERVLSIRNKEEQTEVVKLLLLNGVWIKMLLLNGVWTLGFVWHLLDFVIFFFLPVSWGGAQDFLA